MRKRPHWLSLPGHIGANAAIEMALLAPVLVFMIVGMADYAAATYRRMQVQHAAQAGADFAMRNTFDTAQIGNAVANAAGTGITATPAPVETCGCASESTVTVAICGSACASGFIAGTYINVSAQGSYTTILPYPGVPNSFTFTATAMSRTR
jgi:Flp pilus assembly protein TadG